LHRDVRHLFAFATTMLAFGLTLPRLARADADTDRARALFDEAGELERQGQWAAAQERLRAALRLKETPQLCYALGWALENDDKLLEAKTEYEMAIRLGTGRANAEEAVRLATARLVDLERKTPVIKLRIRGRARVFIDGRELPSSGTSTPHEEHAPVNPGSHILRVAQGAPGAETTEQMVYVGRSSTRVIDIDANETGATRTGPRERHSITVAERTSSRGSADRVLPWVLLGGGALFVAGGAALLVSSADDGDRRDAFQARWCSVTACVDGAASRAETPEAALFRREAEDATSAGNTKQAVGFALGGVGLVGAAVGTVLLLRGGSGERRPSVVLSPTGARATLTF